ncbi:hypothetical protein BJY00DRAFT_285721 [Aspergillus carlsbadensis]|nr:hypothetical protein BJY00DRAFT_285721 [Aspergillus carlsbadensis]
MPSISDITPIVGTCLIDGVATAELLWTDRPLNFWTGIDPFTGTIIDGTSPLHKRNIAGRILALPSSRGSHGGCLAIVDLIKNGCAPAGIVVAEDEEAILAGLIIAYILCKETFPVLKINPLRFESIFTQSHAAIPGDSLYTQNGLIQRPQRSTHPFNPSPELYNQYQKLRNNITDAAARRALDVVARFAAAKGVSRLERIDRAWIDACLHTGQTAIDLVDAFHNGIPKFPVKVVVTGIPVARLRWEELGIRYAAVRQFDAFMKACRTMDATDVRLNRGVPERQRSVLLNSTFGESRPVLPEMIDFCIALTGWAPEWRLHEDSQRAPKVKVNVRVGRLEDEDVDTFYSLLGFAVGSIAGARIPFVEDCVSSPRGKTGIHYFAAGFVATSSAPLFHFQGATRRWSVHYPRKSALERWMPGKSPMPEATVQREDLELAKAKLSTATDPSVKLVLLGDPNVSLGSLRVLTRHCAGRRKHEEVYFRITTDKETYNAARREVGVVEAIRGFGAEFKIDKYTCDVPNVWVARKADTIMTNSTRYAAYPKLLARRGVHFGTLKECVDAAVRGSVK